MEEPGARVGGRGAVEMGEVGSRGMVRVQAEVVLLAEQG